MAQEYPQNTIKQVEQMRIFTLDETDENKVLNNGQGQSNDLMEPKLIYSTNQDKTENIVGPYGQSTSTFGCRHRRNDSKGNPFTP